MEAIPEGRRESNHVSPLEKKTASRVFRLIFICQIFIYMEGGAVPALLTDIKTIFEMDQFQQGLLGAIMYLFASLACPVGGFCFGKYDSKKVLLYSLTLNTFGNFCFAITPEKWVWTLLTARALVGWSQAFIMIWAPTWVDAFAPSDMLTQWYSYLQASVPAGVMVGYLTGMTALFIGGGQDTMYILPFVQVAPWRVPFFLQVVAMGPLAWTLMKIPREHIDTKLVFGIADPKAPTPVVSKAASGARSDSSDFLNPDGSRPRRDSLPADMTFIESLQCGKYMSDLKNVFNPIFICVTLGLSGLYFVVTGVQFWSTDFIISECGGKPQVVMPLFVFTSITAPVGGVLAGGWFIDRMGGYRDDRGTVKSLGLMVIGGSVAVAAAIPASFLSNPYPIFVLIWILLFFGGGVLPAATGINIGSVKPQYRTAANSFSLICFNMLGYFGAPFISGIVMKAYGSYRAGYRTCLSASAFSMIMFLFAYAVAKKNLRDSGGAKTGKFSELTESDNDPETKENALSLDPLTEKQARV